MRTTILNTFMCTLGLLLAVPFATTHAQSANGATMQEVQQIAKEAYIYGNPMVDNYRIVYAYFMDTEGPEYKAPFNTLKNIPRVYTPEDKAVQSPNSDTPYSMLGMDLRTEPMVLTVPKIKKKPLFLYPVGRRLHGQL